MATPAIDADASRALQTHESPRSQFSAPPAEGNSFAVIECA